MTITILSPADGATVLVPSNGAIITECSFTGSNPDVVQTFVDGISSPFSGGFNAGITTVPIFIGQPAAGVTQVIRWRQYLGAAQGYSPFATFNAISNSPPTCSLASPIGGANVGSLTPTLSLNFTDADLSVGGQFSAYQVQVRRVSDQSVFWDPGAVAATSAQKTARSANVTYAGTTLVNTTTYEWRARVQDGGALWSAYTGWASFTPNTLPGAPTSVQPSGLQNTLTPTISGTYVTGGSTGTEADFQYEIRQAALTIYSSADVAVAIATGQTYGGSPALTWGTAYGVRARSKDSNGGYGDWSAWVDFNTNAAPLAPTDIAPGGNAVIATDTPTISWVHNDPDSDAQTAVDIELYDVTAAAFVSGFNPKTLTQSTLSYAMTDSLTLTHQYQLRIRTKATSGPGYGPYSAATLFTYATVPTVNMTAPAANDVESSPVVTVTWTFSGGSGTQASYEIVVFADDATTIIYDSGTVAGTVVTADVPTGNLKNSETYYVQLTVTDTLSQAAVTPKVIITTSFTPPDAVTGLTATAVGAQTDGSDSTTGFATLPNIILSWDESAEALSTFLRYEVFRRNTGDTDWTKKARLTARTLTTWTDYVVASGQGYDYVVTVVADVDGEEISSALPTSVQSSVTFVSLFLAVASDPSNYVQVRAISAGYQPSQPITFVQPRGASDPIGHISKTLTTVLTYSLVGQWGSAISELSRDAWDGLNRLQAQQRDNVSVLLARGGDGTLAYCLITGMPLTKQAMQMGVNLTLQRVNYDDSVA